MKKITVCGYFGYKNAGDELILRSIISNLKNKIEDLEFTVLSCDETLTAEMFEVKTVNRWNPFAVIRSFLGADLVVFTGGLFQDATGMLTVYYYSALALAAKLMSKKVLLYGIEFTPIKRKTSIWMLKFMLKRVDTIAVRSTGSLNFIEGLNIGKCCELSADAVILSETDGMARAEKGRSELRQIGLILRTHENYFQGKEEYLRKITSMCECLVNRLDVEVVFVPFHLEKDLQFSLQVMESLSGPSMVKRWNRPEELFDIIKGLDLIISQRLHGLIIGSLLKTPIIGISNDPKLEFFCNELGQKHVAFREINANTIAGIVEDAWKWQEDFRQLLDKNMPKLKYRSYLNIDHALELISGHRLVK